MKKAERISRFTIRTSDRRVFRRCKRKWYFLSSMKQNLQHKGTEQNINFWFGSAIHFAMEDYFGYNRFGDPRRAFKAYYESFDSDSRPMNASLYFDLGIGMLTYFLDWYPKYNKQYDFQTLWLTDNLQPVEPFSKGAHPAVEQKFFLSLDMQVIVEKRSGKIIGEYNKDMEDLTSSMWPHITRDTTEEGIFTFGFDEEDTRECLYYQQNPGGEWVEVYLVPIYYHGTVDRIVVDKYGRWWILDYKTAKGADTNKLDTDDQISAYLWAMERILKHKIYGFIYLQLTKDVAKKPRRLKDGSLSVEKKQKTTYALARAEIIKDFGSVQNAPSKYIEFLNHLVEKETPEGDRFIRWDFVQRSEHQIEATYNHIMGELRDMLVSNYLYPNPTRDCIWDCPVRDICLAMDDGRQKEVELTLDADYEQRPREEDSKEIEWRDKIKWPEFPLGEVTEDEFKLELEDFDVVLEEEGFSFNFDRE
jgi:hypothetical protein